VTGKAEKLNFLLVAAMASSGSTTATRFETGVRTE
jgi:hypothetical protein